MENDKELEAIYENKRWTRNVYLVISGIVIAIVTIIGFIFGKVVEATLFQEIAKWAVMAVVLATIVCVICFVPVTMLSMARRKYKPIYGKDWFKRALKIHFGKK